MTRLQRALQILSLSLAASGGLAHASTGWEAEWITADTPSEPNSWQSFRRSFTLPEKPGRAEAKLACDSKYWLWINGRLVVFEGQLKRGPRPQATYFDRVDIAEYLRRGENCVAVLVGYFGKDGMSHQDSGQCGLVFQAQIDHRQLFSDDKWKAVRHPAYQQTDPPHPNWRLPESNLRFDARLDMQGWTEGHYDDSEWPSAKALGTPPANPWGALVERPVPQWRFSEPRNYENADSFPSVSTGEPIIAQLPYNAQVNPILDVEGSQGDKIRIQTDNYRGGSEPNVRSEYLVREGRQHYESLGWMNGHRVIYEVPKGTRIYGLKYRETGYDANLAGAFTCSNQRLNTLWKKSQRTLYINMRDTYFDCPDRERAQWWGDVTLELQQAFYALDRRSDRLGSKAIRELAAWQEEDGTLFSPVPAGNWNKELPLQMLASVGRYGYWEYYRHSGDIDTIRAVYPSVRRYLQLWQLGEDGLVIQRKGDWTWGDWGANKDMPLLYNAWYYLALDGLQRMASLLGDHKAAAECAKSKARLHAAFHKTFWTPQGYRSPGHAGPTDDRGNALAVVSGLASRANTEVLTKVLVEERHASPYMEKYVIEALFHLGEGDSAVSRLLDRYGPMIDSPITTLWEGWGVGEAGYGGGSYNHAWSGGPLTLLSQYVAGVDPLEPGYATVQISPVLASLSDVECIVPSPRGRIAVSFKDSDRTTSVSVRLPDGVTAMLRLNRDWVGLVDRETSESLEPLAGTSIGGARIRDVDDNQITIEIGSEGLEANLVRGPRD
ncbi:Bacterial alpha-L-rhamnosidase [Posidoniimonas corsicana]|uniref:alpha-L-rhamnosidase n=1 Tax=Posidoniimonas corsicana TaxID=1938618 RepID=A0A5C5VES9_9BACT|nr:alpha-L-rhamnosidase C-terminal domain-containing protein [Posidoniimonas corsicana]TWT37146.1 Bacterial alpha-L-rhamnosidase [Posidoniimonas corsicana]